MHDVRGSRAPGSKYERRQRHNDTAEGGRMQEKASTLTLRLTAEEAAQLEVLKELTGKKAGTEAIKYLMREYPRFCAHYKQQAEEWREKERKYQDEHRALANMAAAFGEVMRLAGKK